MTARRINDTRPMSERGLDPYATPASAVHALMRIERLPPGLPIYDPCAMTWAILDVFHAAGYRVIGADIANYGRGDLIRDFLTAPAIPDAAIITNPPFAKALEFIEKALADGTPYAAFLLRTNFLESVRRKPSFERSPPSRVWVSSRRLPMMHRLGYEGPVSTSNQSFMWAIWQAGSEDRGQLGWFDHAEAAWSR
jgi:hypothetical protein